MFKNLVYKNRTIRRFDGSYIVSKEILEELVDLARMTPSSMNLQPLKYYITNSKKTNELIYKHLIWAGCQVEGEGSGSAELPTAHIIVLRDTDITKHASCDHGIAAQTIMLGATEKGLGGCMHSGFKKAELQALLNIPEKYQILFVLS